MFCPSFLLSITLTPVLSTYILLLDSTRFDFARRLLLLYFRLNERASECEKKLLFKLRKSWLASRLYIATCIIHHHHAKYAIMPCSSVALRSIFFRATNVCKNLLWNSKFECWNGANKRSKIATTTNKIFSIECSSSASVQFSATVTLPNRKLMVR